MDDLDAASPEVELWRAVVAQAISDATATVRPKHGKRSISPDKAEARQVIGAALVQRDEARAWLLGNSRDFQDVCHMARLDPDAVRAKAERLKRFGWEVRVPARLADALAPIREEA